ncbi:MAG: alpha/beta hydrolase family protein [Planctomycetota bacterium]|jgi:dienelactone hydrolase
MSDARETFEVEVDGGAVRATYAPPADGGKRHGAVLVCRGLGPFDDDATADLLDAIGVALRDAGVATAEFESRSATMIMEDFDAYTAQDSVDEAVAMFRWLADRDDVDAASIGVLGFGLGGVTAAGLARRVEPLDRLALLAAAGGPAPAPDSNGEPDSVPEAFRASLEQMHPAEDVTFYPRPVLLIHGAADRAAPPAASHAYCRALEAADRPVEHLLVARADHHFEAADARDACIGRLARFFADMPADAPR